jgi:rubrerythrin
MGNKYSLKNYQATILPERNYISDLINNEEKHWEIVEEKEYNDILEQCKKSKEKVDWL